MLSAHPIILVGFRMWYHVFMNRPKDPALKGLPVKEMSSEHFDKLFKESLSKIDSLASSKDATIEEVSQSFLDIALFIADYIKKYPILALKNPNIVGYAFSAQKILLEKQRVKMEESTLKLGMAKMFGGFFSTTRPNVVDGEIVPEKKGHAKWQLPVTFPESK